MGRKDAAPVRTSKRKAAHEDAKDAKVTQTEEEQKPKRAKKHVAAAAAAAEPAAPAKDQHKAKAASSSKEPKQKKGQDKKGKKDKQQQLEEEEQPKRSRRPSKKKQEQEELEEEELEEEELEEEELEEEELKEEGQGQGEGEAAHEAFMEEVKAKEEELGKHCVIMEQAEGDEDETTLEELRALKRVFVPQQVQDDFIEVWSELDEVGQDEDEDEEEGEQDQEPDILGMIMRAVLGGKMLNTQHSAQMHAILKAHQAQVDKAIKAKSWQAAFCRWAATLIASRREPHWYEDTDVPADAEAIYAKMRQQWTKLRTRSDQELGGLVAEGGASPLAAFDAYLQGVADDMRAMDYNVEDVV